MMNTVMTVTGGAREERDGVDEGLVCVWRRVAHDANEGAAD